MNAPKLPIGITNAPARHSRLAIGILVALLVIFLAGAYAIYRHLVEAEEEKARAALNRIADIQTAVVSVWMAERLADATVFSGGRFLGETINEWIARGARDDNTRRQVLEQLLAIKTTYKYVDVCIFDVQAQPRISTGNELGDAPPDPLEAHTVRRAAETNSTQVSSIHAMPGAAPDRRIVHIATPLLDTRERAGKMPSILALTANVGRLLESFAQQESSSGSAVGILIAEVRDGRVVTTAASETSSRLGSFDVLPIGAKELAAALQTPKNSFLLQSESGGTMVSAARRIDHTPWVLVAMTDQDAIRTNVRRLAWLEAGALAALLTVMGTVVLLWWKKRESELRLQALQATTEMALLQRQAEEALHESESRLNGILESILDVVWSFSPDLSRMHYINQSAERIYGYPVSAFLENPRLWFNAIHPEDRPRVEDLVRSLTADRAIHDTEYRVIRRDGEVRWLHCKGKLVADEHGRPLHIDGVTTDITERKKTEQQVQLLAYYDSVTMLPNRRLLQDRLAQALHMATRSEKKVALLYMDLDNFKNINDSLGHHIGDMLLREIAERLLHCVRGEDTVARIGGDEFLVVLPDIDEGAQAVHVAEKILAATARPIELQGNQVHTTISIGISIYPTDAREPRELMQHADSALYQAKGQGRDNYQFFTQELNLQIMRSSSIERQLREAVDAGNLSLWYQPQIDIGRRKLIGAEALLRCRRSNGDFLLPAEFIPVAEERGLIARIGEWAIREACLQCRRWQACGLHIVPIAVNVSPLQFQQKGFSALVTGILADAGLDANYLELEITESSIMRRASQVAQLARQLREAGVGISIDDFGTGYSSLSYLKQIPLDKIKIDRSFISDMLHDDDSDAITYAIINLAHSLNLRVIAEGVEHKAQIDRLRMYGCDEVQGHYYSCAVSAQAFERFLADERLFLEQ